MRHIVAQQGSHLYHGGYLGKQKVKMRALIAMAGRRGRFPQRFNSVELGSEPRREGNRQAFARCVRAIFCAMYSKMR